MASSKENFVKALKELTGFDEEEQMSTSAPGASIKIGDPEIKKINCSIPSKNVGGTCVTKTMKIVGDMAGTDDVEIRGRIDGNVSTIGNLISSGVIVGDVRAANLLVKEDSVIKGAINVKEAISAAANSIIIGDISAKDIKLDGKVKGDLVIEEMCELTGNALISGNIKTSYISTNSGSRIKGNIITKVTSDVEDDVEFNVEV